MIDLDPGLLAAIIESPQDDLPRLLAADWYRERGEEARAEFIEVQVELAAIPKYVTMPPGYDFPQFEPCTIDCVPEFFKRPGERIGQIIIRRNELISREGELLFPNEFQWSYPIPELLGWTLNHQPGDFEYSFHRGFINHVECSSSHWLQHAEAIIRAAPIERVTLTTYPTTSEVWGRNAGDQIHRLDLTLAEFKERWPRIKFNFPEPGGVYRFPEGSTHRTVYVGPGGEIVE